MELEEFRKIVDENILPVFVGSRLVEEVESSNRTKRVSYNKAPYSLLIRPKNLNYRIRLDREQSFSKEDKHLMEKIVYELDDYDKVPDKYKNEVISYMIENAIASYLARDENQKNTLKNVLIKMREWSLRTYEGRDVTFGIEIKSNRARESLKTSICDILNNEFSALLSDGIETYISSDNKGHFIDLHKCINIECNLSNVPRRFCKFAASLGDSHSIGVVLLRSKEILIIQNNELVFAYRRGSWKHFTHNIIVQRIAARSCHTELSTRYAIHETMLDVSFARTGGSITYLRKSQESKCFSERVYKRDLLAKKSSIKAKSLHKIVANTKFKDIDRKIRQELVGIDGATILDSFGFIVATGAIIRIEAGSQGGGRLASVKSLSKYGPSIKISSDGEIQGYYNLESHNINTLFKFA